jgi:hypothetical protein
VRRPDPLARCWCFVDVPPKGVTSGGCGTEHRQVEPHMPRVWDLTGGGVWVVLCWYTRPVSYPNEYSGHSPAKILCTCSMSCCGWSSVCMACLDVIMCHLIAGASDSS